MVSAPMPVHARARTLGLKYDASILNSEPMAPSMAHPDVEDKQHMGIGPARFGKYVKNRQGHFDMELDTCGQRSMASCLSLYLKVLANQIMNFQSKNQ